MTKSISILLQDIKGLKRIPVVLYARNSGLKLEEAMTKFKGVQFLKKGANFRKFLTKDNYI